MIKLRFTFVFAMLILAGIALAGAQGFQSPTVCCEQTISGLYCQDVPPAECNDSSKMVPTSCKSTTYCKPGICFDSIEGTCLDNTPQNVCNQNDGIWTDKMVPQCQLGCCILGDQAAFVTQTRCKKLSSFLGLETNYRKDLQTEVGCISSVLGQEKGACVYESELQKTCRMTTRAECGGGVYGNRTKGDFYPGKLCSAEELGTNCGLTTKTRCYPGNEEVYFVDSCGNTANIYDASKINDKEYWSNMKSKEQACNPNSANANSASCGNCNYLLGSFCRATTRTGAKATYGENICADLNCKNTVNGKDYKHGESWCVNSGVGVEKTAELTETECRDRLKAAGIVDSESWLQFMSQGSWCDIYKSKYGSITTSTTEVVSGTPGSAFYKHICINGEEILEACADYRQQVCIEGSITYKEGAFSQAACRVNRWQDCTSQTDEGDCTNSDVRDCTWMTGHCLPRVPPGLKFWEGDEAKTVCGQLNQQCRVKIQKTLYGSWEVAEGKNCGSVSSGGVVSVNPDWLDQMNAKCGALGDCGNKINFIGTEGNDKNAITVARTKSE